MSSERASLRQALVETCVELLSIPSETGEERALCDHVQARLLCTFPASRIERRNHSLVLKPAARRDGAPLVALVGHLDTVPPQQDEPAYADELRVHGCGASDMKAGLAVMIALAERFCGELPGVDVVMVFYEAEEGKYELNGLHPLLEEFELLRSVDLAFCLEPSDNRLQMGSLGGIHATLTFRGQRAHSASPWQGVNAIHRASSLLADLEARQRECVHVGNLVFYEVISATVAESLGARNVIPESFRLNVNYRFAPGKSIATAQAEFEAFVAGRCDIEWTDLSPSGSVCLDNPHLKPLLALAHSGDLVVEPKQAWTDVARLGLFGVDAVNFGPGESAQAHQRNESTDIDLMVDSFLVFEAYLSSFVDE